MDIGIRSGTMIDLNEFLYLVGGVHCTGKNHEKPGCTRTDAIYRLQIPNTNQPSKANWVRSDFSMVQPKSSQDILKVPLDYCNRIFQV